MSHLLSTNRGSLAPRDSSQPLGREICGCLIASSLPEHRLAERWLGRRRGDREPFILYRRPDGLSVAGVVWPRLLARLRDLHHPHILTIDNGSTDEDGSIWLRSPFPGTYDGLLSVAALMARKDHARFDRSETLVAIQQVLEASAHAHRSGIVHGTIAPEEVQVNRRAMIMLECYGVERELGVLQGSHESIRTAELRSIGALAHMMLTGSSPSLAWERVLRRESVVPRRFRRWLSAALSVEGFPSAEAALAALRTCC